MWREDANSEDLSGVSVVRTTAARTTNGAGWCTAWLSNPECATEQVEHAWLGILELSAWTWIAWTAPVKATSSTHSKHRNLSCQPECPLCPALIKRNAP
jgi:hypothetical protein